jgi:hypothetical protein
MAASAFRAGQRVELSQNGQQGTIRFVGQTLFAGGEWIGLELDTAAGKNDGSVQGERYFSCRPAYGMFVRPSAAKIIESRPVANGDARRRLSSRPASSIGASSGRDSSAPSPTPATRVRTSLSRVCLMLLIVHCGTNFSKDNESVAYKAFRFIWIIDNKCQAQFDILRKNNNTYSHSSQIEIKYQFETVDGPTTASKQINNNKSIIRHFFKNIPKWIKTKASSRQTAIYV